MVTETARIGEAAGPLGAGAALRRLVEADGTGAHPHWRRLVSAPASMRDLSDVVHAFCSVHGRHPGIADEAHAAGMLTGQADWLAEVAAAMVGEREYLGQLVAAAGHLPSTPGQANSEAALVAQHHALSMLARSERGGCAGGAIAALVIDWQALRRVFDIAADRFGMPVAPFALLACGMPAEGQSVAAERAMAFGAQQLLAQHRGLWDLLEARAGARS